MATASAIGTSFLSAMFLSAQLGGHGAISQFDHQTAAQPHFPDASVEHILSCGPDPWTRSIEVRNSFHHNKLERNLWFMYTQWCRCFALAERSIFLCKKILPGITTLVAWVSRPMRDSTCRFVAALRRCQFATSGLRSRSLSAGRRISNFRQSSSIPKKGSFWEGPSFLSSAGGMPSRWHT